MSARIKSVWFRGSKRNYRGFSWAPTVCENGAEVHALFRFSEMHMRWERVSSQLPRTMTLVEPMNFAPGGVTMVHVTR